MNGTPTSRRVEALAVATRTRRETAEKGVLKALKDARKSDGTVTVTGIATAAGVSTDFIYRNPALRQQVEALRRTRNHTPVRSPDTTDADAADSTLVRRLTQQLADLRHRYHHDTTELKQALAAAHGELIAARRQLTEATVPARTDTDVDLFLRGT